MNPPAPQLADEMEGFRAWCLRVAFLCAFLAAAGFGFLLREMTP